MFVPLRIKKTEIVALKARNGVLLLPRPKEASGVVPRTSANARTKAYGRRGNAYY